MASFTNDPIVTTEDLAKTLKPSPSLDRMFGKAELPVPGEPLTKIESLAHLSNRLYQVETMIEDDCMEIERHKKYIKGLLCGLLGCVVIIFTKCIA